MSNEFKSSKVSQERESLLIEIINLIFPHDTCLEFKLSADIDPAIATVPHLLDLLTTSRAQNITLQDEVQDLTTKVRVW